MTLQIQAPQSLPSGDILTDEALEFLTALHHQFNDRRVALLKERGDRQKLLGEGKLPTILTNDDPSWKIAQVPHDLLTRHVEITGPTDAKMVINALNSGADVFMADFEDANVPTWKNLIEGQRNLIQAINKELIFSNPDGKNYLLNEKVATLMVRPRGWHLNENHLLIEGQPSSGSLFDFGLYFWHNGRKLVTKGSGPYFYLPKLENHQEARLWNDVFIFSQKKLGLPQGTIKATVLIETILAALEMEAILYELKQHSAGLNAGRWDYIFSIIKKFQFDENLLFPDRQQITMTTPFMHAYTSLLVQTCHKHGAHAMGGMAAYIPNRKDAEVNAKAMEKVREDKIRESREGFDGTWVAHPDLVPIAKGIFAKHLKNKPHQLDQLRSEVNISTAQLLDFTIPHGAITETGFRHNISIAIIYLESWLRGIGAVAIYNLMEDAATAEISRAQVWQWLHHPNAKLSDGRSITPELYRQFLVEECKTIEQIVGPQRFSEGKYLKAKELFNELVTTEQFEEFLTLKAYANLDK